MMNLSKKIVTDGRDAHTPYTQAQSLDGRLVQKNISSATDETNIPKKLEKSIKELKQDSENFIKKNNIEKGNTDEKER